jgi:hypothetical protein
MQKSAGRHAKRQAKLNERIAKRARIKRCWSHGSMDARPKDGPAGRRGCKSSRSPAPPWRTDANHRLKSMLPCIGRRRPVAPTTAAFITEVDSIQRILEHLGEPIQPPLVACARGPTRWEEDADQREVAEDAMIEPLPAYEFVQAGELVSAIPGQTFLPVKAFFTGWNQ